MRILHVITRLILGGAQQNTVMSCKAQVDAGHEVHLAYGPIHGPEGSLLEEAKASGATLHEIKPMVRELSPLNDWRCYQAVRKLVRELRPDIVHSHSSKAGILVRAAAWKERRNPIREARFEEARKKGIKLRLRPPDPREFRPQVIHTVHGLPFHDEQSKFIHNLYVRLEMYAAKRCDHLIAITPEMVEAFVEKDIASAEKFTVIPSGIDVEAFTPRPERRDAVRMKYGIPQDALVVGHVGRLDPLKGHADLLDQLPRLRENASGGGGRDVWLFFVGDGFHRAELEKHPSMALGKTVMTGLVPLSSVPECLAAMDVMALPSYQEGQSRTLCEALLCGVPVVGYDVGGIPSVIKDGETGRLIPLGNSPMLGQALLDLLGDPGYLARLAERGRQHVMDHFSATKMNRELLELYDTLLTPPSAGPPSPGSGSP
ncbi:glycosyltransferase family 4 protein [Algisphaera agarilytica]|uniref:Glycosyltransferase involved in cell wall biosynthesis n=1 Tax=Algisphaera agarilytica TaxID=1385975 RepID=A0A7X0H6C9_9BACT|nr:glycosyltransferase family 4 protein [Algisphaera agarilytica]MBB6428604.1 glycosyltransferase involved in cell wall biosynthesis [Algisphaera agarilytica]